MGRLIERRRKMKVKGWREGVKEKERKQSDKRNPRVFMRKFRQYGFRVFQAMEYGKDDVSDLHHILWKNPKILREVTEMLAVSLDLSPEFAGVLVEFSKGESGRYTKSEVYDFCKLLLERYGWR